GETAIGGSVDPGTPVPHTVEAAATVRDTEDGPVLSLTLSWPAAALDQAAAEGLGQAWLDVLGGLAAHAGAPGAGGHTPSDFPLVRLTPRDVTELESAVPGMTDIWPLSPLQEGMLFHATFDRQGPDVYQSQRLLALDGPVDVPRLRASWEAVLARHPALRAGFHRLESGEPVQVVAHGVDLPWREADLSTLPAAEAEAERLAADDLAGRFDPARPPLLRLLLVRLGAERYRLAVTSHHLLVDGWSTPVVLGEVSAAYAAGGDGTELPPAPSYRSYLDWLGRQDPDAARAAWRAELAGADEPTLVAPAAPTESAVAPETVSAELAAERTRALDERVRALGVTVNTAVQVAWALVLARLTGRTDVVFGGTVAGRPPELPGVEAMVGLFINTLPVRVRLDGAEPVAETLTRTQKNQSALIAHQHLRLPEIQHLAGPGAGFDTMLMFENYPRSAPVLAGAGPEAEDIAITQLRTEAGTHYPLAVGAVPGDRLRIHVTYRPDVFGPEAAGRIARGVLRVLEQMAVDVEAPVGRLDVLEPVERVRVLEGWGGAPGAESVLPVPELVAGRVAVAPEAVAVSGAEGELSYGELGARSGR
ncbi:condensation domain-containing protein, partial [Streptomyces zingiberis]